MSEKPPNKILLMLGKEWIEIRQQRSLLLGMILPPLFFSVLPLGFVVVLGMIPPDSDTEGLIETLAKVNPAYAGMTDKEGFQALMSQQMSLLFLLLPTILTSIIASFSIVGEKQSRTLEPVLATPVTTSELMVAKALSALIPAVLATWFAAMVFVVGIGFLALTPRVFAAVVSPGWLIALVLITPLLGLTTVALTIAVSSRVSDPRSAQQISVLMIIPVMLLFFGQITGFLILSPLVALLGVVVMAGVSAFTIWIAGRVFHRESILTRWT
jgi:ABC-2 type transport system permease protein